MAALFWCMAHTLFCYLLASSLFWSLNICWTSGCQCVSEVRRRRRGDRLEAATDQQADHQHGATCRPLSCADIVESEKLCKHWHFLQNNPITILSSGDRVHT